MNTCVTIFAWAVCLAVVLAAPTEEDCDKTKCKGPMKYMEDLSCEPIYKKKGDCCPYKYDCKYLENRSKTKCVVNGNEYDIGEHLKPEDGSPCDIGCTCSEDNGVVGFDCAVVDCPFEYEKGCYQPRNASECCEEEAVCPEKDEDWPICVVDGKTYKAGEYFRPAGESKKDCYCGTGYKGENIAPWCTDAPVSECGTELRHAYDLHHKCVPVYHTGQNPQTSCPFQFRCQNERDQVIKPKDDSSSSSEESSSESSEEKSNDDARCEFGSLKMRIGEELNQKTHYDSVCVKCICEVPPIPTCVNIPETICNVTDHPPFPTN